MIICYYFYIFETVMTYAFEQVITITIPRLLGGCREQKLKFEILEFLGIRRNFLDFFGINELFDVLMTNKLYNN